jgi:hypothetical protein
MKTIPFTNASPIPTTFPGVITCDKCGNQIPLTDVMHHQISEEIKRQAAKEAQHSIAAAEQDWNKKLQEVRSEITVAAEKEFNQKAVRYQMQIEEMETKIQNAESREFQILEMQKQIETEKQSLALRVERTLAEERSKIRAAAEIDTRELILLEQAEEQQKLKMEKMRLEAGEKENVRKQKELEEAKRSIAAAEEDWKKKVDEAQIEARTNLQREHDQQFSRYEKQIQELGTKLQTAEERELQLLDMQKQIETEKHSLTLKVERTLADERTQIRSSAEAETRELILLEQAAEREKFKVERSRVEALEKEALRKQREVQETQASLAEQVQLTVERRLSEEANLIRETAISHLQQDFQLKLAEKDQQISLMNTTIADLQRKGLQGSQQIQGEVQDLALQDLLELHFSSDNLEQTPTGVRGADLLQTVILQSGKRCGSILWESKRTKHFNEEWVEKAKQDKIDAKADLVVIVSSTLPKDATRISTSDGVFVCDLDSAICLAVVLRVYLKHLAQTRTAIAGMSDKADRAYNYIVEKGSEHLKNIANRATLSIEGVQKEKRWHDKRFAERMIEIEEIIENAAQFYGELQFLTGNSLPMIEQFEIPEPGDDKELTVTESEPDQDIPHDEITENA